MFEFPKSILAPDDVVCEGMFPDLAENYYHFYFDQIKRFGIKSMVEIGVRAGYSAYAMLQANPLMRYVGYDIDAPNQFGYHTGAFDYAKEMLAREFPKAKLKFITQNTQELAKLPGKFDLGHVDGDHSLEGCSHDLLICSKAAKIILADDYDFVPSVKMAVDSFIKEFGVKHEYIPNFRGMMILHCVL